MCETAKAVSSLNSIQIEQSVTNSLNTTAKNSKLQQLAASLAATSATAAAAIAAAAVTASTSSTTIDKANSSESRVFNVISQTNEAKKTTINTINLNGNNNKKANNNNSSVKQHQQQQIHDSQQSAWKIENQQKQQILQRLQTTKLLNTAQASSCAPLDFLQDSRRHFSEINGLQKRATTEDLISSGFLSASKIFRDYNNFANVSPSLTSTIINESDFPQLGVRWSPPFSTAGGSASTGINSPVNVGGLNFGSNNSSNAGGGGLSMGSSSTATSPMVPMHAGNLVSSTSMASAHQQQQQTSFQSAMFMRDSMLHMGRPYEEILGKSTTNGMYAKVTGGMQNEMKSKSNLIRNVPLNAASNEFRMQNEDFPALPASQLNVQQSAKGGETSGTLHGAENAEHGDIGVGGSMQNFSPGDILSNDAVHQLQQQAHASSSTPKSGIQTHPDGLVTNIPANMLNDQYGMAGLLTFLRTIENDPAIIMLALGLDLTNLGLNLNSSKKYLHETFGGPWADAPCRIQDLETKVPAEYLVNADVRDKLPHIKLNKLADDVLFYLFYNCPGEVYQLAAASELFSRDWRFHKTERIWLARNTYMNLAMGESGSFHTGSYEKSTYNIFDPIQWRKIPKDMVIEYKQLEHKISPAAAAGSTPNMSAITGAAAAATHLPPPGMMGSIATAPGFQTRMMGMPMQPLQAHAMAAAAAAAAQQRQQQQLSASSMPPLASHSGTSIAHGAVGSVVVGTPGSGNEGSSSTSSVNRGAVTSSSQSSLGQAPSATSTLGGMEDLIVSGMERK